MAYLPRSMASQADVAMMLGKAVESGIRGAALPCADVIFTKEQLLYINTVYDKARNNARPSRVPATRKS